MDPLVIIGLVVLVVVAFVIWRAFVLKRSADAYTEGSALVEKGDLTPAERERLDQLQKHSKAWGPEMDPTLSPMERLDLLPDRDRWLAQNVTGDEDPRYLRIFADGVVTFALRPRRDHTAKELQALVLEFCQMIFTVEETRLQGSGMSDEELTEPARQEAARVGQHFFGDRSHSGDAWQIIAPPGMHWGA